MTFVELARARFSCRAYEDRPVESEKIQAVLEAGRLAPSACNNQPWHFVVVRDPEQRRKLNAVYPREWFSKAPVAIVVCGDHSASWKRGDSKDHCDIDIAIAADHMTLQATALGLATCWICAFNAQGCASLLGVPTHVEPVVILPLGYPASSADPRRHAKERKELSSLVHWDRFDGPG